MRYLAGCIFLVATTLPLAAQVSLRTFNGIVAAHAGDVNNDGRDDVVVGDGVNAVVYSGRDYSVIRRFSKIVFGNADAWAVAGGVDFNKDGYDDVVVGTPRQTKVQFGTNSRGAVRVWSGKDGKILHEIWGFWAADRLGSSVAVVGDVNKDSYPDFAVGADWGPVGQMYGYVLVLSGKDAKVLYVFPGSAVPHRLGYGVAAAGDVDKDGYPDIIAAGQQRGRAEIFSGKNGKRIRFYTDSSGTYNSVSGAGDINNDGYGDVIVGTPNRKAVVYSGKDGGALRTLLGSERMGYSVTGGSDMNADGVPDVIVGAPTNGSGVGRVYAYSGKDWSSLFTITGGSRSRIGTHVEFVGDLNGDGTRDFVVATDTAKKVTLYSGDLSALSVDATELSISKGGTQNFYLNAGATHGLKIYLILGTDAGTTPGINLGGVNLPLNPSPYFSLLVSARNVFIKKQFSALDKDGKGTASITLPKNLPTSLIGTTAHHAYVVANLAPFRYDFASNAVSVKLVK